MFSFEGKKFHEFCDNKGIYLNLKIIKGSTLIIMKTKEEESSLFGGMAVPS